MENELMISIKESDAGKARVRKTSKNGNVETCIIPVQHLAGILDSKLRVETDLYYNRLNKVPEGYIDGFYADSKNFVVMLEHPAFVGTYLYSSGSVSHAMLIPFPKTLFIMHVKDGKFFKGQCFALKGNRLCRFPFANVYDNGDICWGSNEKKQISFSNSSNLVSQFFSSGFNTHLYHSSNTKLGYANIEDLLRFLSDKDSFLDKWLVSLGGETISGAFNSYCKTIQKGA